ncbi:BON domain-containing protein [Streptomyces sp. NPDC057411]|uniref:BON domain-containing protein n=1 Tax=unclassified Streptomyces TaxID=2593676 RepID=UPI003629F625
MNGANGPLGPSVQNGPDGPDGPDGPHGLNGPDGANEDEYRVARLRERLAGDDLAELGVRVEQRGAAVVLTGTVPTTTRRSEIVRIAHDELTGFTVHADLEVACADAPDRWEELS